MKHFLYICCASVVVSFGVPQPGVAAADGTVRIVLSETAAASGADRFPASVAAVTPATFVTRASSATPASAPSAAGTLRAEELLGRLAEAFRAMRAYEVSFEIRSGDFLSAGSYAVDGADYFLTVGDAVVYADGAVRYEVDNRRREITVTELDSASRNILNNPVRAFDFLGSEYAPELLSERDGEAVIRLTPTGSANAAAGSIAVTLSTDPVRPRELSYEYDGERVTVRVTRIAPLDAPLRRFDRQAFPGYEFIDFR